MREKNNFILWGIVLFLIFGLSTFAYSLISGPENIPHDANGVPIIAGETNDSNRYIYGVKMNSFTGGILADIGATMWNVYHINTNAGYDLKNSPGVLHRIVVNTLVASETISIYDTTNALCNSGHILAPALKGKITLESTTTSSNPFFLDYDGYFKTGICIWPSSTADLTATWR